MEQEIIDIKNRLGIVGTIDTIVSLAEDEIRKHTGLRMRLLVMGQDPPETMDALDMAHLITKALGMCPGDLQNMSRKNEYVQLRYLVMLFVKEYFPKKSLREIGMLFSQHLDHTTVIHGLAAANNLLASKDDVFTEKYELALQAITQWIKE